MPHKQVTTDLVSQMLGSKHCGGSKESIVSIPYRTFEKSVAELTSVQEFITSISKEIRPQFYSLANETRLLRDARMLSIPGELV